MNNSLFAQFCFLCTPLLAGLPALAAAQERAEAAEDRLAPVSVSATRTETEISELARSVTVVEAEELEKQASLNRNLSAILANTVPGFGPSTEAVTNFGQTLRGRNFLVLIDGIPQSTPLRDASRDLNTISPSSIERIEVVRGGTAAYGFGAAGGLVNIITKKASPRPEAGYAKAGVHFSTEEVSGSGVYDAEYRLSGTRDTWDYVFATSVVQRNGAFDADGRRIPPDPLGTQGGFADTDEFSLLAKAGRTLDADRRLEFMVNRLENEQDSNYTFTMQRIDGRTRAQPISEAPGDVVPDVAPGTNNTVAQVRYRDADLAGSTLDLNTYYGDQKVVFPKFPGFSQGDIRSEKMGLRATVDSPAPALTRNARVVWGADYLRDDTVAESINAQNDTPDMVLDALAGFANVELPLGGIGLLRGGVRHEIMEVDTTTVEQNGNGNRVNGGTLEYDETLLNAGVVFYLSDSVDLFANFSQGFSIADIGRVIRDAGSFGGGETFNAEEFESDAEKTDNYELGLRVFGDRIEASLAAFYTQSENGVTFDDDLDIQKFDEEIHGLEAAIDYTATEQLKLGATATWSEGDRESESGAEVPLDGTRISPVKLTGYLEYAPWSGWNNRLQVGHVNDRDRFSTAPSPDTFTGFGLGEVDSYTLVDLISRWRAGPGNLTVTVRNLLNKDYVPAINQAFNIPTAFSSGPGRTAGISYDLKW